VLKLEGTLKVFWLKHNLKQDCLQR